MQLHRFFSVPSQLHHLNGVTIESGALKRQLSDYNQSHNWTCTGGCSATYTLTLSNLSRGYNGTTYQCYVGQEGAIKSGIVTLFVRDGHSLQTYVHTYIHTDTHTYIHADMLTCTHTHPSQTLSHPTHTHTHHITIPL